MKSRLNALLVCVAMLAGFGLATPAFADAGDHGRSGHQDRDRPRTASRPSATLKDNKGGALVIITITDDLTLDKFKDKRIVEATRSAPASKRATRTWPRASRRPPAAEEP